jgi:NAD(P)-dependent dehydrogenase (short-subunit alcohol dehydrogenase family)
VNSVAPFVLQPPSEIMKRIQGKKHIINVSAMEGKFHRFFKEDRHPHTNMAKAALNMLTHFFWDFSKRWNIYECS